MLDKAASDLEMALQRESEKLALAIDAEKLAGKAAVERCHEEINAIKTDRDNTRQELIDLEKQYVIILSLDIKL